MQQLWYLVVLDSKQKEPLKVKFAANSYYRFIAKKIIANRA